MLTAEQLTEIRNAAYLTVNLIHRYLPDGSDLSGQITRLIHAVRAKEVLEPRERQLFDELYQLLDPGKRTNAAAAGQNAIAYYDPEDLVTVKEASGILNVSRWKVDDMRNKGELTTPDRNGRVALIRDEVEAARLWYSVRKGKV